MNGLPFLAIAIGIVAGQIADHGDTLAAALVAGIGWTALLVAAVLDWRRW